MLSSLLGSLEYDLLLSTPPWLTSNSVARVWGQGVQPSALVGQLLVGLRLNLWPLNLKSMEKPSAKEHPELGPSPPRPWGSGGGSAKGERPVTWEPAMHFRDSGSAPAHADVSLGCGALQVHRLGFYPNHMMMAQVFFFPLCCF